MIRRVFTVLGMAALAVASVVSPTRAAVMVDHGYAERTVCVITTPDASGMRVIGGINAWNAAQSNVLLVNHAVPGCGLLDVHGYGPTNPGPWPEEAKWQGYAWWSGWTEGSQVGEVWRYHQVSVYLSETTASLSRCDKITVVAHEIGHALGLDHTTGRRSVMSYDYNAQRWCGQPSATDIANIAALYPGL